MKRLAVTIGVATLLLLSATPLFSQDAIDETTLEIGIPDEGTGGDESLSVFKAWDFIKMLLILGAVIAVIYGLFHFLKKSGNPKFNETRLIRVLSSKTLTGARALHLVEVGNQIFLVGTSENAVNLVSEIADKETLDSLKLQAANAQAVEKRSFASILGQTFGRPAASKPNTAADPMAFLRQQRQRIRNM